MSLIEDGCMMYSHVPKVSFILKPEDIKALHRKSKRRRGKAIMNKESYSRA